MTIVKKLLAGLAAVLAMAGSSLSQTCNDHIIATAPDSRYTNHGNGTVTDNATGLMWKQCVEGLSGADCSIGSSEHPTWQEALQRAQNLDFAGHTDWRLPNIKELSSLVEEKCYYPSINATIFPNTPFYVVDINSWPPSLFWSSTPDSSNPDGAAWAVDFNFGATTLSYRFSNAYGAVVRLVRGGQ